MIQTVKVDYLTCCCYHQEGSSRIAYMIYPQMASVFTDAWLSNVAAQYNVSVCIVYVPSEKWNDVLTPWPEPPEAPGFPPFAGEAQAFLTLLTGKVVPVCDKIMGLQECIGRDLIGVSLAGLFTLWQWMQCSMFDSIACLSGSFWYAGFLDWFKEQPKLSKSGKAYFLLGKKEPSAPVKAYRTVGVNTEAVVERLQADGIKVKFEWVPGTHIDNPLPRAHAAFGYLYENQ